MLGAGQGREGAELPLASGACNWSPPPCYLSSRCCGRGCSGRRGRAASCNELHRLRELHTTLSVLPIVVKFHIRDGAWLGKNADWMEHSHYR